MALVSQGKLVPAPHSRFTVPMAESCDCLNPGLFSSLCSHAIYTAISEIVETEIEREREWEREKHPAKNSPSDTLSLEADFWESVLVTVSIIWPHYRPLYVLF